MWDLATQKLDRSLATPAFRNVVRLIATPKEDFLVLDTNAVLVKINSSVGAAYVSDPGPSGIWNITRHESSDMIYATQEYTNRVAMIRNMTYATLEHNFIRPSFILQKEFQGRPKNLHSPVTLTALAIVGDRLYVLDTLFDENRINIFTLEGVFINFLKTEMLQKPTDMVALDGRLAVLDESGVWVLCPQTGHVQSFIAHPNHEGLLTCRSLAAAEDGSRLVVCGPRRRNLLVFA